jgi:hypothetical protein
MLRITVALIAALGMTQAARAQATAGDQGAPGRSVNQGRADTPGGRDAARGAGTQGIAQPGPGSQNNTGRAGDSTAIGGAPLATDAATGRQAASAATSLEGHLADCLILKNEEEIAILQFAQDRIQNDELKQAARKMIDDHQQAISKLERFAMHRGTAAAGRSGQSTAGATGGEVGRTTRETLRPNANDAQATDAASGSSTSRGGTTTGAQSSSGTNGGGTGRGTASGTGAAAASAGIGSAHATGGDLGMRMYQIAQREKEQCLQLTKADLQKHEGEKFDKALTGQQSVMHASMLAKLNAIEGQTSAEFNQLAQQLAQTTQQHKEHLDQLMTQLDRGSSRSNR